MVLLYKIVSIAIFLVFIFYVFDIRKKPGMEPLIAHIWTGIMKLTAGIMMVWFIYVVSVLQILTMFEWIALAAISLGTFSVVTAKVTLGRYHTWAGYHKVETSLITHGIYSYIRHPLYTGAVLVELGVGLVLFNYYANSHPLILIGIAAAFLYMIPFNVVLAGRETQKMREKFGAEMDAYAARVRPFIPIRKKTAAVVA